MVPPQGEIAVGAMWYKAITQSVNCPGADKPDGFDTGSDTLNWAVVVAPGLEGLAVRGGNPIQVATLVPGLNMGQFTGFQPGPQRMELWDGLEMILWQLTVDVCLIYARMVPIT